MITVFVFLSFLMALLAAGQFFRNLPMFLVDDLGVAEESIGVSILIPARDEEAGIESSVRSALAQENVEIEVVVLDDHSTDRTAKIVRDLEAQDSRVRYILGQTLPDGWNGKQHACFLLAKSAKYEHFMFIDADVCLQPTAVGRLLAYRNASGAHLLSAFPRQETTTWLEQWIIPMMHYILLCYLPFDRMRAGTSPAYASGCGQLFFTDKASYLRAGTHEAIASSRHDGLKLPKAYRVAGLSTDVIDGTRIATCRMYQNAGEVVRGVLKNATEGIANARLILPFTALLLAGSVLPWGLAMICLWNAQWIGFAFSLLAVVLGHAPRWIGAIRFKQPMAGVIAHSPAVMVFIALQWVAMIQSRLGYRVRWRGRMES